MSLILYSCNKKNPVSNKTLACTENLPVCKISLNEYSNDSIQIFTTNFKSDYFKDILKYYHLKEQIDVTIDEIISCEKIIRNDSLVLNSFLDKDGKKAFVFSKQSHSGYYSFGRFQMLEIEKYKRQYFGVLDSNNNEKCIVLLFDYDSAINDNVKKDWQKSEVISRPTGNENQNIIYYIFLIDLVKEKIELIKW